MGSRQKFLEGFQLVVCFVAVVPFQISLDEIQMVFGIIRRQFEGALQMPLCPGATADADDRGRFAVEQPQVAIGASVIKGAVEVSRSPKLALHFSDKLE